MRPTVINESRPFDPDQPFYSRTDKRGVIAACNKLFADVSGYPPETLLGAPHRLVRHPDMPKQMFAAVWSSIQSDRPIGAYIKNLSADGRYYWVFACVFPLADGYRSVRIAPRAQHFDLIPDLYRAMLAAEAAGTPPAEVEALMLARLSAAGYENYGDFMVSAALAEIEKRAWTGAATGELRTIGQRRHEVRLLEKEQEALLETFRTLYLIPTNMRILASRLEPSGGPVSAISDSYKRIATELMARLNGNGSRSGTAAGQLVRRLDGIIFNRLSAMLTQQAASRLSIEPPFARDPAIEVAEVATFCADAMAAVERDTEALQQATRNLLRDAESLQRLMAGLEQVRILGEVESGRLRNRDGGLASIMQQLEQFHARIRDRLTALINLTARMTQADEQGTTPIAA